MRLIDAEDYLYRERPVGLSDELYEESRLYKSIMEQEVIKAIPLDRIKQAREEIDDLYRYYDNDYCSGNKDSMFKCSDVLAIIDRLIESEG